MDNTASSPATYKPLTVSEMREAINLIDLTPPFREGIDVGSEVYSELLTSKRLTSNIVGSLYGVEIRLDSTLKPNQIRINKNGKNSH